MSFGSFLHKFASHGAVLLGCVAWAGARTLRYSTTQQFLMNAMPRGSPQIKDRNVGGARLDVRMPHMLSGTFVLLLCQVGGCSQHCCHHPLPGPFVSGTCHFVPLGNATEDPTPWLCPVRKGVCLGLQAAPLALCNFCSTLRASNGHNLPL